MDAKRAYDRWVTACVLAMAVAACDPGARDDEAAAITPDDGQATAQGTSASYLLPSNVNPRSPEQPIPFSHAQHVGKLALECAVCHVGAGPNAEQDPRTQQGRNMTLPDTQECMNCHTSIAADGPGKVALAEYHAAGEAVPWIRVYEVLDGVKSTHKAHLEAGIACETCHGRVSQMEVMTKATAVTAMASCLDCHRANQARSQCETCHAWPAEADFQRWSGAHAAD